MFARDGSKDRSAGSAPVRLGTLGLNGDVLAALRRIATPPQRGPHQEPPGFPSVQFDIDAYVGPARGAARRPLPLFTLFATARLLRRPWEHDQRIVAGALNTIEAYYPFSPGGVFACVGYGLAFFDRLPGGVAGPLVGEHMPRMAAEPDRPALEELAAPEPAEVGASRLRLGRRPSRAAVQVDDDDLLLTLRSDSLDDLRDVAGWLQGSNRLCGRTLTSPAFAGLVEFTSARLGFLGAGIPARLASACDLGIGATIDQRATTWTGFLNGESDGAAPAPLVTLQRQCVAAGPGTYFHDGAVQHLRQAVVDVRALQIVDELDARGYEAEPTAHLHWDVPGVDAANGWAGGSQPVVHSSVFAGGSAELEVACDTPYDGGGPGRLNCGGHGSRRLVPARWQSFLVPPRCHRALPLVELTRMVAAD